MRDDDQNHPDHATGPSTGRPATARIGPRAASSAVLALLMVGTSWVVASWVSAWLVPPYLTLMALILLPSTGRPQGGPAGLEPDSADALEPGLPGEGPDDPSALEASTASAGASGGADLAADSTPTKGRRGKGKARRAKPVAEPVKATWIEVAPGKFVRSEGPRSTAEAGPHGFMGVPSEVPTTSQPQHADEAGSPFDRAEVSGPEGASPDAESAPEAEAQVEEPGFIGEPDEDASPAFDTVEGPAGDPSGDVEASGSPELAEPDGWDESPGLGGRFATADGIAPQVEESPDEPSTDRPGAGLEASDDRTRSESGGERSERVDDPASDDFAPSPPIESPDLILGAVDESEPTLEGSDDLEDGPTARATTPEPEALTGLDDPEGWDEGEGSEVAEADGSSNPPDPEPIERPAPADVALEFVDESRVAEGGDDPTETAVDETVLDDAGTSEGAPDDFDETPAADLLEEDAPPGVPSGSAWWPRRLAPRARTRDGHDARAASNAPPSRRPVRSRGPARRPPDPRRLTRRGAGRPRQITRTFPPRSPPRGASAGGRQ